MAVAPADRMGSSSWATPGASTAAPFPSHSPPGSCVGSSAFPGRVPRVRHGAGGRVQRRVPPGGRCDVVAETARSPQPETVGRRPAGRRGRGARRPTVTSWKTDLTGDRPWIRSSMSDRAARCAGAPPTARTSSWASRTRHRRLERTGSGRRSWCSRGAACATRSPGAAKPPQNPYPPPWDTLIRELHVPGDDCLTLNVWTPEIGSAGLPVMVWISGGQFMNGHHRTTTTHRLKIKLRASFRRASPHGIVPLCAEVLSAACSSSELGRLLAQPRVPSPMPAKA